MRASERLLVLLLVSCASLVHGSDAAEGTKKWKRANERKKRNLQGYYPPTQQTQQWGPPTQQQWSPPATQWSPPAAQWRGGGAPKGGTSKYKSGGSSSKGSKADSNWSGGVTAPDNGNWGGGVTAPDNGNWGGGGSPPDDGKWSGGGDKNYNVVQLGNLGTPQAQPAQCVEYSLSQPRLGRCGSGGANQYFSLDAAKNSPALEAFTIRHQPSGQCLLVPLACTAGLPISVGFCGAPGTIFFNEGYGRSFVSDYCWATVTGGLRAIAIGVPAAPGANGEFLLQTVDATAGNQFSTFVEIATTFEAPL